MANPRVFISSTYYDLKHVRSSLENFIELLGYEPILSEKGDIAFTPDTPLDESCYREVRNADIFVMIIGGRYGSEKSEGKTKIPNKLYDRYDSVTKQEYRSAIEIDIPSYILIEKAVYADYETYLRNKDNKTISYAHVDSINIFTLIEDILSQPRNNPVHQFERYSEIESWLKAQWAGLFRELLSRMTSQQQLTSLASQVGELSEINKTLKTYLEEVVSTISPKESAKLIKAESNRLKEVHIHSLLENKGMVRYLRRECKLRVDEIYESIHSAKSLEEFVENLRKVTNEEDLILIKKLLSEYKPEASRDFERIQSILKENAIE